MSKTGLHDWTPSGLLLLSLGFRPLEDTMAARLFRAEQEDFVGTTPANPLDGAVAANAIGPCQICRSMRQTAQVTFHRNVGMLLARQNITLKGTMCKTCLKTKYWEFQGKGLLLGPWGMISLVVTPIYLITNTVSYLSAARKLRNAVE